MNDWWLSKLIGGEKDEGKMDTRTFIIEDKQGKETDWLSYFGIYYLWNISLMKIFISILDSRFLILDS